MAQLPVSFPTPASQAGSLFDCLPDGSLHVGLLAQFLSWEQTGGSGKVGPTRVGLRQLNCVNGRHLSSRQEKGSWVHPGEGGAEGRGHWAAAERSSVHPLLAAALHKGPPPLPTEAPPRLIYGFFSVSSSVIMDQWVLKKQTPCKA